MHDVIELCGNPSDAVYATLDDFGATQCQAAEPAVDELPFHIPRD